MRLTDWRVMAGVMCVCLSTAGFAQADEILAQYHMGETGSLAPGSKSPIDMVGSHNLNNLYGGAPSVIAVTDGAPGSTAALSFGGNGGFYYTDTNFIPADNFRIEVWAKPATVDQDCDFLSLSGGQGHINIGLFDGNWTAGHYYQDYVGGAGGAGQPASADAWTKLAFEQVKGVSTFYINDVAQSGISEYTNPTENGGLSLHVGIAPNATSYFNGALDELTISTVSVPEPSVVAMLGAMLAGLACLWLAEAKVVYKI